MIHLRNSAARAAFAILLAGSASAFALPAAAQQDVTEKKTTMEDVAMTPLSDLNIRRDPIPQVLVEARNAPYNSENLGECEDIRREVGNLDAVLGDDFDTAQPGERDGISPTGVARSVIGSFIPFRGIIREISGANDHEYNFREAIAAGLMRRAYLKGIGREWECPYPASPAPSALVAKLREAERDPENEDGVVMTAEDGTRFVSQPVVQSTD